MNALRVFFVGGLTSYRALFNWINPLIFVTYTLNYPIFEILFFVSLGRFAGVESDEFFLVGNAFMAIAVVGFFGMSAAIANERRSQTLSALLASPANRLALFLGRALPSMLTGVVVAALAFTICALILDADFTAAELRGLAIAALASSFACTSFGLCLGSLGFRGRNITVFADAVTGSMLILSGANVPLENLPGWVQAVSNVLPLTHGIEAGRRLADGETLDDVSGLLAAEVGIGACYLVAGLVLLRYFEYQGRRSATLEAF
jgi:ABC-2 type transport system permease protein